jgi:hypothetical protein
MAKLWYSPVPLSSENTALWQGGGADSQRREGREAEAQRFWTGLTGLTGLDWLLATFTHFPLNRLKILRETQPFG